MDFGKVNINPITIGVWAFFVFADGSIYALLVVLAALLHECAHLLAIRRRGAAIDKLHIHPFGVNISLRDSRRLTYPDEIIIALSGPMGSLLLGLLTAAFYFLFLPNRAVLFFAAANLAVFALNMLPIECLDGGRMLKNALLLEFLPDTVARVLRIATFAALIPLTVLGVCMLAKSGYNFSVLLLSLYLFFLFLYKS